MAYLGYKDELDKDTVYLAKSSYGHEIHMLYVPASALEGDEEGERVYGPQYETGKDLWYGTFSVCMFRPRAHRNRWAWVGKQDKLDHVTCEKCLARMSDAVIAAV